MFSLIYSPQPYPFSLWLKPYKIPAAIGFSSATIFSLFSFSVWDLIQNISFFGTTDYLKLIISEPKILQKKQILCWLPFLKVYRQLTCYQA